MIRYLLGCFSYLLAFCAPSPYPLPEGEGSKFVQSAEQKQPFRPSCSSCVTNSEVCKPDMVYILDRGHGLHFYSLSSMPALSWSNLFGSVIEHTE
jgi:hypothetical protein